MGNETKLVLAFDLDGVIASPILDGLLINLRILKEHLIKSIGHKTDYFYPKAKGERLAWLLLNRLRRPTCDLNCLRSVKNGGQATTLLITSRFKFLERDTRRWLKKYGLENLFDKIIINTGDLNPVEFKIRALNENSVDYYLDDDVEVIESLRPLVKTTVYWRSHKKNSRHGIENFESVCDFVEKIKNNG